MTLKNTDIKVETWPKSTTGMARNMSSGIRVIHMPTGIAVKCSTQRSQHGNRAIALKQLEMIVKEYEKKY